jgi:predicted RNase H-like HicB family nuclease
VISCRERIACPGRTRTGASRAGGGGLAVANLSDPCYKINIEINLTAAFRTFPEGYAAVVEEPPGANTKSATLEKARANLKEAVEMVLQGNRDLEEESLHGAEVVRYRLALTSARHPELRCS